MIRINKMGNEILFDEIYRWGMRYYLFGPVILVRYNFAFSDTRLLLFKCGTLTNKFHSNF